MANTNLADMKLPELRELAKEMKLRGTSTMRKPELIERINEARQSSAPASEAPLIELSEIKSAPARSRADKKADKVIDLGVELPVRSRRKPVAVSEEEQAEREASRHQAKADLNDILSALPDRSERERAESIAQAAAQREQRGASHADRRNRISRVDRARLDEESEKNERSQKKNSFALLVS